MKKITLFFTIMLTSCMLFSQNRAFVSRVDIFIILIGNSVLPSECEYHANEVRANSHYKIAIVERNFINELLDTLVILSLNDSAKYKLIDIPFYFFQANTVIDFKRDERILYSFVFNWQGEYIRYITLYDEMFKHGESGGTVYYRNHKINAYLKKLFPYFVHF